MGRIWRIYSRTEGMPADQRILGMNFSGTRAMVTAMRHEEVIGGIIGFMCALAFIGWLMTL